MDRLTNKREADAQRWTPVSKRMPEKVQDDDGTPVNYLIAGPHIGVDIGYYCTAAGDWHCAGLPVTVTHWMPLPKAPEVE